MVRPSYLNASITAATWAALHGIGPDRKVIGVSQTNDGSQVTVRVTHTVRDEPCSETTEPYVDHIANGRARLSKKRHKQKVIHQQTKFVPKGKLLSFLERVTDPNKEERLTEFLKDPFRGLNHR